MGIPVLLVLIIGIFLIYNSIASYIEWKNKQKIEAFLKEADYNNIVPKKKLDEIKFINIDLDKINFKSTKKETINKYKKLYDLSKEKMANFENETNFNLKEKYGVNNFQEVLSYQENYDNFLKLIVDVAENLYKENLFLCAQELLEIGVELKSDITKNYTILADIYNEEHDNKKLFKLIDKVLASENISQQKIMKHISSIKTIKKERL